MLTAIPRSNQLSVAHDDRLSFPRDHLRTSYLIDDHQGLSTDDETSRGGARTATELELQIKEIFFALASEGTYGETQS